MQIRDWCLWLFIRRLFEFITKIIHGEVVEDPFVKSTLDLIKSRSLLTALNTPANAGYAAIFDREVGEQITREAEEYRTLVDAFGEVIGKWDGDEALIQSKEWKGLFRSCVKCGFFTTPCEIFAGVTDDEIKSVTDVFAEHVLKICKRYLQEQMDKAPWYKSAMTGRSKALKWPDGELVELALDDNAMSFACEVVAEIGTDEDTLHTLAPGLKMVLRLSMLRKQVVDAFRSKKKSNIAADSSKVDALYSYAVDFEQVLEDATTHKILKLCELLGPERQYIKEKFENVYAVHIARMQTHAAPCVEVAKKKDLQMDEYYASPEEMNAEAIMETVI